VASASDRIRVSGEQRAPASAPLLPGALVTESTAVNDGLWMPPGGKARTGRKGVEEGEGGVGAGAECGGLLGRVLGEEGVPEPVQLLRRISRPLQRRSALFLRAGARALARAGRRPLGRHGIQGRRARVARGTGRRRGNGDPARAASSAAALEKATEMKLRFGDIPRSR